MTRSKAAFLIMVLLAPLSPAITLDQKIMPAQLTLEDVIFDAAYLKKLLGPQTLLTAVVETNRGRKKSDTALSDAIQAIKDAQLDAKTQFHLLPDDAIEPMLKPAAPHTYPPGLKLSRETKNADFLMLIGADGAVKGLYCYNQNDRLFALAAAMAVVKWRYEPALVQDTAVPVLASLPMSIEPGELKLTGTPLNLPTAALPVPRPMAAPNPPPSSR